MSNGSEIKVWDPLVRLFHWALVAAFTIAYLTEDELKNLHIWAGYTVLGLVSFRVLWGLIGTRHARFGDFVYRPSVVVAYLKDILSAHPRRYLGHNPAGGAMVIVLLLSLLLTTVSGMAVFGVEDQAGPLAGWTSGMGHDAEEAFEEVHEFFANFALFLVVLHIAGVIVGSIQHHENLPRAMITGRKRWEP